MPSLWSQLVGRLKYLRQFIREKERAGFEFENIPDFKLDRTLKTKKQIQKALKEAHKWTAEKLYKHGTYSGEETYGETIPASEARRARREYRKAQTEYMPQITMIDFIKEQINNLPDVRYFKGGYKVNVRQHKDAFVSLLDDIEINVSNKEEAIKIEEYFQSKQSEIVDSFLVITWDSEQFHVESAIGKAYAIIKGRSLTFEEAEELETVLVNTDINDEFSMGEFFESDIQADRIRSVLRSPNFKL